MAQFREFVSQIYLRRPPFLSRLRTTPVLGSLIHYVSHKVLPSNFQVWHEIEVGAAKGLWIKINPRTGREICEGIVEPETQKVLVEHLRPGMVFYDAGANVGLFTLAAARLVGERGKVFSFEPDAGVARRLRENASYNGFAWVSVLEVALSSHEGEVLFARADASVSPDRGVGRIVETGKVHSAISVRATTLDDFSRDHPIPDLLKCDVEGAEVEVLRGGEGLLRLHHPAIICELHSPECEAGVRRILEQHSYSLKQVDGNHFFAQVKQT